MDRPLSPAPKFKNEHIAVLIQIADSAIFRAKLWQLLAVWIKWGAAFGAAAWATLNWAAGVPEGLRKLLAAFGIG